MHARRAHRCGHTHTGITLSPFEARRLLRERPQRVGWMWRGFGKAWPLNILTHNGFLMPLLTRGSLQLLSSQTPSTESSAICTVPTARVEVVEEEATRALQRCLCPWEETRPSPSWPLQENPMRCWARQNALPRLRSWERFSSQLNGRRRRRSFTRRQMLRRRPSLLRLHPTRGMRLRQQ